MFEALETGIGLDIVLWFQQNRAAWMEVMVQILDQIGLDLGYVALFGFIFWAVNKRHGIRLTFALVVIAIVSFALKDAIMRPRPYLVSDLVTPVFEADGFGVPSGHTSFAVMIWGYIAIWLRKGWVWVVAISYMLLQGFGRMIAGVHFPQDVVAGFLVGIVTLAIYYPTARRLGQFWLRQSLATQFAISIFIPVVMAIIGMSLALEAYQVEAYLTMIGLAMGIGLGASIEHHFVQFQPPAQPMKKVIIFVIGAVTISAILLGLSPVFDLTAETGIVAYILRIVRYALTGFTAIALVPMLGIQLNLLEKSQQEAHKTA